MALRGHFRAGFASADITPDPETQRVELSGYVARHQPAVGVRDRIRADALALAVDDGPAKVLLSLDLCALDASAVRRIAGACPVPDEDVIVACSHTHAAPAVYRLLGCGEPDPAYVALVARRAGDAARRALAELVPCRLGWGRRALPDAPWGNRRDPGGPSDPRLHLLKVERAESDRAPICGVWCLACHPVVLTAENRLVSADFVGAVRTALPWPSLFLQGCSGDQNPLARGEEGFGPWTRVAQALAELWAVTTTAPSGAWGWAEGEVALPRLRGDPADGPAGELVDRAPPGEDRVQRAMAEWARTVARPGQEVGAEAARPVVGRLGQGRLAFWPGEPFVSLGLRLPEDTVAVGHVGPSLGYVPDREAYARPGYEAGSAHRYYGFASALAPEAGERLVDATRGLLAGLG